MDNPEQRILFDRLCDHANAMPDRNGEVHATCPNCAKEAKAGQTHFSFSLNGAHCFVCGGSWGLFILAQMWGALGAEEARSKSFQRRRPKRKERPPQPEDVIEEFGRLLTMFELDDEIEPWWSYAPTLERKTISDYRLCIGRFPRMWSKCQHKRLMVPLMEGSQRVVGFRGRSIDCDCGKWLSPKGSRMLLYLGGRLDPTGSHPGVSMAWTYSEKAWSRKSLFIVENPVDALLLEQRYLPDAAAVATLGVSNWRDEWTEMVKEAGVSRVLVAYDNDRPGNGGGERGRRTWLASHERDIMPNGIKLANRLQEAGIDAHPLDWGDAPLGMDVGDRIR